MHTMVIMKKNKAVKSSVISNRRARHDYALEDSLVVGVQLTGAETKSLRRGHGNLRGAYVTVKDSVKGGDLWLVNATITSSPGIIISETDQTRSRKLLAKRKQIDELVASKQQGRTIVPLEFLTNGRYVKLRIAAGRGKKHYDKRHDLKAKDDKRATENAIKFSRT
jgi:SsrA-binding protein